MADADLRRLNIAPLARDQWDEALPLLTGDLPPAERAQGQQALVGSGSELPTELWGAFRGRDLVAVMRLQPQQGRAATVTAPRVVPGEPLVTSSMLLETVLQTLRKQSFRLVQALLLDAKTSDAQILRDSGFTDAGELEYLVCLAGEFPRERPETGLEFLPCGEQQHAQLAAIIERTYVGSLDCPAADGLRSIDDVLAGYCGSNTVDPSRWLIASENGIQVGCLIIADEPEHNQSELMYIGVVPEARGRGLGLSLVRHAQWLTRAAGRGRLVLAVDAANAPALAIYAEAGFVRWNQRSMFLRAL